MKYKISEEVVLDFSNQVIRKFLDNRQHGSRKEEAGGILLGRIFPNYVLVEDISLPSVADKRGKRFFMRSVPKAQTIVNDAWRKSNGQLIYLGEWHTHSENHPNPSKDDKDLIKNMLKDSIMEIDFLLLVIVGLEGFYVGFQKGNIITELSEF